MDHAKKYKVVSGKKTITNPFQLSDVKDWAIKFSKLNNRGESFRNALTHSAAAAQITSQGVPGYQVMAAGYGVEVGEAIRNTAMMVAAGVSMNDAGTPPHMVPILQDTFDQYTTHARESFSPDTLIDISNDRAGVLSAISNKGNMAATINDLANRAMLMQDGRIMSSQ